MSQNENNINLHKDEPTRPITIKRETARKYANNEETIKIRREKENQKRMEATKFKREIKFKNTKQFEMPIIFATIIIKDDLVEHIYQLMKEKTI